MPSENTCGSLFSRRQFVPSRGWQLRIYDILQAIAETQQFVASTTFEDFQTDKRTTKAVLYNFAVIGEAAGDIPTTIQSRYPQVPWRLISDVRNVTVHEYFQVELKRVWRTIDRDLPPLVPKLREVLERESGN